MVAGVRVGGAEGEGWTTWVIGSCSLEHDALQDHVEHDQEADEDDVGEHKVFVLEGCHM